jgi:hypothetical protein
VSRDECDDFAASQTDRILSRALRALPRRRSACRVPSCPVQGPQGRQFRPSAGNAGYWGTRPGDTRAAAATPPPCRTVRCVAETDSQSNFDIHIPARDSTSTSTSSHPHERAASGSCVHIRGGYRAHMYTVSRRRGPTQAARYPADRVHTTAAGKIVLFAQIGVVVRQPGAKINATDMSMSALWRVPGRARRKSGRSG